MATVRTLALLAALAAGAAAGLAPPAAAAAGEPLTLGFLKRARAMGGETAALAERYVDGTLHGMLLLSDSLQQDGRPVFCADATQERLGLLEPDRLSAGFADWLADGAASDADVPEVQDAPIAMFALSYLTTTLPCPQGVAGRSPDDPGGEAEEEALDDVLRRALPQ
jgi:hypothetical protein